MLKSLLGFDFGRFPIYWLMLIAAFVAGWITYGKMFRKCNFSRFVRRRVRRCFFWSGVCALFASHAVNWLLYPELLHASMQVRLTQGGYSSFFGLLVFFGTAALFLRMGRMKVRLCLNQITPAILLALFLARIGCTLTGCCHGRPIALFGATFRFPTTELEAIFALTLFIVLQKNGVGKRFWIFSFSYSALRFVLEFFRGDDRGSLFGIQALTPVQMIAPVIFVLSAYMLFKGPFCRYFLLEHKVLARKQQRLERLESRGKKPYEPYAYDYTPKKRVCNPLHALGVIVLCLVVVVGGLIYINPFGSRWSQNVQYYIDDALGGGGYEQTAGQLTGVSVQDASGLGKATNAQAAKKIVTSYDPWTGAQLDCAYEAALPSGGHLYGFYQNVQGVPVFGTGRALVTDSSYNALYVAGDESGLTYTNQILPRSVYAYVTVDEAFGPDVMVIDSMDCWYDTGEGLVAARQVILSSDGATPVIGAILDRNNDRILALTGTKLGVYSSVERNRIYRAAREAALLIRENDPEKLQQLRNQEENHASLEQDTHRVLRSLLTAYQKTGLEAETFLHALEAANMVADYTPNLNAQLYSQILAAEIRSTLLHEGVSVRKAQSCAKQATKAFSACGIQQLEDEPVTELTVKNRKSSFPHTMAGRSDSDVFRLGAAEDKAVEITVSTHSPVKVEVCEGSGAALTSLYVEQEESFVLYPEDGTDFTVVVSAAHNGVGTVLGEYDYELTVTPAEEEIVPLVVTSTLYMIEQAYKNSNAAAFYALCVSDLQSEDDQEMIMTALFMPILAESCSGCQDQQEYMDMAKTMIATELIADEAEGNYLDALEGSSLKLTYVSHAENEVGMAVKAKMELTLEGVLIYDGYTFFQLVPVDYTTQMEGQDEEVKQFAKKLFSSTHCISKFHTDDLYAAFGDTRDNISHESELTSLYALQSKRVETWDSVTFTLRKLDEQAALSMGHSPQKVDAFYNYTLRQNIMSLKQARATLKLSLEIAQANLAVAESAEEVVNLAETAYDLYTDPAGTLIEAAAESTEFTKAVYNVYSWLTSAPEQIEDMIKDEIKQTVMDTVIDPYAEACRQRCNMLTQQVNAINYLITDLEKMRR